MATRDDSPAVDLEDLEDEYLLLRQELNLERKAAILYGVGQDPATLNPDLLDLSVQVLGELLGYEFDELAKDVVRWQNDTICDGHFHRDQKTGKILGRVADDLILAYRGGGKSTWGTVVRSIWYLVRDPDIRIGIVSETEDLPKAFLVEIEGHLLTNADLISMFGRFKGAPIWEAKRKTVVQRTKVLREPTLHAFSVGGQSAGYHYDVLIADDLVTYKGSRTKVVRTALSDWYDSTFGGLQMQHTINHHTGTPYFPGDLYDRLQNGREDEKVGPLAESTLLVPAEYVEVLGTPPDTVDLRRANSPSRLPLEALDRIKRKIGRVHYATQYLMDRSKMIGKIFSIADFQFYDGEDQSLQGMRDGWARYLYFDLFATKKDEGDYFAGICLAVAPDKSRADLIDLVRFRGGKASKQRRTIMNMAQKHRATLAGVEAVQMQTLFAEELQEMTMLPIQPVKVEGDKVARAISILPQIEAGKIYLPMEDTAEAVGIDPDAMRALVEELIQFPDGDHDDTVDALTGCLKLIFYGGAAAAAGGEEPKRDKPKGPRNRARPRKLRARYS